jgi:hypothetical protein
MAESIEENKNIVLPVKNVKDLSISERSLYLEPPIQIKNKTHVSPLALEVKDGNPFIFLYKHLLELNDFIFEFIFSDSLFLSFVHIEKFFICGKVKVEFFNRFDSKFIELNMSKINNEIALYFIRVLKCQILNKRRSDLPALVLPMLMLEYESCDLKNLLKIYNITFLLCKDVTNEKFISFFRRKENFVCLASLFNKDSTIEDKQNMIYIFYNLLQNCSNEFVDIAGSNIDGFAIQETDVLHKYILGKYLEIESIVC